MNRTQTLTRLGPVKYRHISGALIEFRSKRVGHQFRGWAIVVEDREVGRWSTLERAAEEASK